METETEKETENPKKNIDKNSVHDKDTDYHTHDDNTDIKYPWVTCLKFFIFRISYEYLNIICSYGVLS